MLSSSSIGGDDVVVLPITVTVACDFVADLILDVGFSTVPSGAMSFFSL